MEGWGRVASVCISVCLYMSVWRACLPGTEQYNSSHLPGAVPVIIVIKCFYLVHSTSFVLSFLFVSFYCCFFRSFYAITLKYLSVYLRDRERRPRTEQKGKGTSRNSSEKDAYNHKISVVSYNDRIKSLIIA